MANARYSADSEVGWRSAIRRCAYRSPGSAWRRAAATGTGLPDRPAVMTWSCTRLGRGRPGHRRPSARAHNQSRGRSCWGAW